MPIPDGANRVVYSGGLLSGVEAWAFGLWWTGSPFTLTAGEPTDASYVGFRDAFRACMSPLDTYTRIDSYVYSGGVAVEHHSADFNYAGTGSSTVRNPSQCAVAITLRTALATRNGRGRIYVPYTGQPIVVATGLAGSSQINNVVDKLAAYFTAERALGTPAQGVVVSQTQGVARNIISVDADLVVDTMRRRRNRVKSTRHAAAVT